MRNIVFQTFGLTKLYKDFRALDSVNMTIYEGDIYGFVGENGAGKTTLIRLACGLAHQSEGYLALFGVTTKEKGFKEAQAKTMAIVESVAVSKGLTALENLKLQCKIVGINKTDDELNALLDQVGLDSKNLTTKKANSFSLGMRQRLGLAIALVSEPKFILLDEPMNGLDPQGFVDIRETILRLNKQGVSFLISSHILSELDKICTRVGFLSHGRLLKELGIDELHEKARKKIALRCKNSGEIHGKLVEKLHLSDTKVEGDNITIYDQIDINDVISCLAKEKILIDSITSQEETIEDYYSELMRGGNR